MKKRVAAIAFVLIATAGVLGYGGHLWQKKTLVSVVMLTYQREKLVPRAIESILSQSFLDFELIVLDDGSTDKTEQVVRSYADKRLRYYKNPQNIGIARSRNRAASLVRGRYVLIMDDDDKSLPERMAKQVAFMENNPDIAAVAGQIKGLPRIPQNHDEIAAGLIQYNNFGNANVMYRRKFAETNHIRYDEKLKASEDWDFWLQMLFAGGKFASLPDDVLERDGMSAKHYGVSYEEANVFVRRKVSAFFAPQQPEEFDKADACGKLRLIAPKNIFSNTFLQQLLEINCSEPPSAVH